jgi:hypothetical protein
MQNKSLMQAATTRTDLPAASTTEVLGAIVDALSTLETDVERDGP